MPGPRGIAVIKIVLFIVSLLPAASIVARAALDQLGANPVEKLERLLGYWTLVFLMMTLLITPLRKLTGWSSLARTRRMLGLFAFFYAVLHFLTYLVFDQFFDLTGIVKDIAKRPYITVGFTALVMLVPLAITSTDGMMRRLGGQNWRRLHRLVYLAAVGGVVHHWWLVKKDITDPARFATVLAALLGVRAIWAVREAVARRGRVANVRASVAAER